MRILFLDIETSPHKGYFWGLFQQNIGISQLIEPSHTLCWAAKWYRHPEVLYGGLNKETRKQMLQKIWKLLDEADVVVHFYGKRFDIPTLNKEFILLGMSPPSPYKQVDLKEVAARVFKFASNKLEFLAKFLGIGAKIKTDFDLWKDVLDGCKVAWNKMETYNKQDTKLLEPIYDKLLPWIPSHPNHATYEDGLVCPQCGGQHYIKRGFAVVNVNTYTRYQCKDCARYFRGNKAVKAKRGEKFVNLAN